MITAECLTAGPHPEMLTERQSEVFAAIERYHAFLSDPCPAPYLVRQLGMSRGAIREHLAALHRKGWLKTPTSPSTPRRPIG